MGLFSWMTSDTNESISVADNPDYEESCRRHQERRHPAFTVAMKDNHGNTWIEKAYAGYGEFGGKDYFEVVAEMNPKHPSFADVKPCKYDSELRCNGLHLAFLKDQDGIIYPTLSRDPDFEWRKDAKPENCPDQGYFYDF